MPADSKTSPRDVMCIYYTPHQSCYSQPQHDPQDAQFRIPSYSGFSWHLSSTKSCWFNLLLAITRQLHQCMAAFWVYLNSLPAAGRAAVAVIQPLGGNPVKSLYWGFSQHWLSTPKVPKADEGQDPPAPLPMRQGPSHCNQAGAGPPEQRTCL